MTISAAHSVPAVFPLVFIADDDIDLAQEVAEVFDLYSFRTQITESWAELIKAIQDTDPDLILLDKQLGRVDAVARIGELRRETSAHIIIVTGYGSAADCIIGLELGADGFLTKPVSSRELVVRVRAVLRRKPEAAASSAGKWQVMLEHGAVQLPDGRRVLMAQPHLAVLDLLIGARGKPLSRQALMVVLEDDPAFPTDREQTLTRILGDLRRGLAGAGAKGALRALRNRGLAFLPANEP